SLNSASSPMIGGQYYRSPSISQIPTVSQQQPYDTNAGSVAVDSSGNGLKNIPYDRSMGMQEPSPSLAGTVDFNVNIDVPAMPSSDSYSSTALEQPRTPVISYYSSLVLSSSSSAFNNLPSMTPSQVPANYFCYNNLQIVGNINVQNIFPLDSLQQTSISDIINSQSQSSGYSFSSFHYPYHTIVINLKVNIYVHTLTLGSQSNVQRYSLRLYNPSRNVDDTYYSSILPESNNQSAIVGIPLAKVAIRLYLNIYTTNDGKPPSNIKIMINACFDSSSINIGSSPMIGGQYYRSPSISQTPTELQQQTYIESYSAPAISMPTVPSQNIIRTVDILIDNVASSSGPLEGSLYSNVRTPYDLSSSSSSQNNNVPDSIIATDPIDSGRIRSEPFIANIDVNVDIGESSVPSVQMQHPDFPQQILTSAISNYHSPMVESPSLVLNNLPSMMTSQVPANYFCYNNLQIVGNINVQNIFHLDASQQTHISDIINSQSQSSGYSFSSFHYPYHTIVINLRVNIYVHSLTLGSQS
ncbi:unnamed protein product, partial [Rotaria sp. Silwood2]